LMERKALLATGNGWVSAIGAGVKVIRAELFGV